MARRKARSKTRKRTVKASILEPVWNSEDENTQFQISNLLNWYHQNKSKKDALLYFEHYLDFIKMNKKEKRKIKSLGKQWIVPTLGWCCRIIMQNQEVEKLPDDFEQYISKELEKIKVIISVIKEGKQEAKKHVKKKPNVQEYIKKQTETFCVELEEKLDNFLISGAKNKFNVQKWMEGKKVKSKQALEIAEYFEKYKKEFEEVLTTDDADLQEAYSHYTKAELKRMVKFIDYLIEDCKDWSDKAKIIKAAKRKPRKRKPKSPLKQVAKLNYMESTDEFGGLKSVPLTRIVGATELWIFNVKTRTLGVYHCTNPHGFSVKGTTIQNFDIESSISKKLRKPKESLDQVFSLQKRGRNKILQKLSTKENRLTGRINKHTIILRVEK